MSWRLLKRRQVTETSPGPADSGAKAGVPSRPPLPLGAAVRGERGLWALLCYARCVREAQGIRP